MKAEAASVFATAFLAGLIRGGVHDVVVCPGSRSQALALAAAAFERAGQLKLHVRIDERSAGFLALGLALETDTPVAVITTSGTAVANLHPAVLEAAHTGVPLVLVSADRPDYLRGIGANQTTQQFGIFANHTPGVWDVPVPTADAGETGLAEKLAKEVLDQIAGPRHVNMAFDHPLSAPVPLPKVVPGVWRRTPAASETFQLAPEPGTVVLAGTGAGAVAEETARKLGAPLLAEVTSGARFGPNLVPAYRELLDRAEFVDHVRRAIVFGHPTLSRQIPSLLTRAGVESIVVRGRGLEEYNPGRRSRFVDRVSVAEPAQNTDWARWWVYAARELLTPENPELYTTSTDYAERAAFARAQLAQLRSPITRRALVRAVWNATWPHDRLFLGASRLIRELDREAPGKRIRVYANRGLAGIDGTVATATGVALAALRQEPRSGVTRVLLGDLTLLHDVGSLLLVEAEAQPQIQLVVGNDGGGTIFDGLEVAETAEPKLFDRVLYTPQAVDFAALASAYGWEYRAVTETGQLKAALSPTPGATLVEVSLARR